MKNVMCYMSYVMCYVQDVMCCVQYDKYDDACYSHDDFANTNLESSLTFSNPTLESSLTLLIPI